MMTVKPPSKSEIDRALERGYRLEVARIVAENWSEFDTKGFIGICDHVTKWVLDGERDAD